MRRSWKRFILPVGVLLSTFCLLSLAAPLSAAASQPTHLRFRFPIDRTVDSCTGEQVAITGTAQEILYFQETSDSFHFIDHINWQGVHGVGLTSGLRYQAINSVTFTHNIGKGESLTFTGTFMVVAQGLAPNLVAKAVLHLTVNANGEVTSDFTLGTFECRG
jgi:hypothetical protein